MKGTRKEKQKCLELINCISDQCKNRIEDKMVNYEGVLKEVTKRKKKKTIQCLVDDIKKGQHLDWS